MGRPCDDATLAAGLKYATLLKWHLIPVHIGGKKAKQPWIEDWPTRATDDPVRLKNWHASYKNDGSGVSFGLACGPRSGVWVVDLDVKDGKEGIKNWEALVAKRGGGVPLPETTTARTGSGGLHLFYKWPSSGSIGNSRDALGKGIDIRGAGGQVVLPPTPAVGGGTYTWEVSPFDVPPAEAPEWLVARAQKVSKSGAQGKYSPIEGEWAIGKQEETIFHYAFEWGKANRPISIIETAILGKLRTGEIPSNPSDPWTEESVREKVRQGWNRGLASATGIKESLNQFGDVSRVKAKLLGEVIHATGLGWFRWDGARWYHDADNKLVTERVKEVLEVDLTVLLRDASVNDAVSVAGWRKGAFRARHLQEVMSLLAAEDGIRVTPEELDDPGRTLHLLNFQDCTVDLRTGDRLPHDKELYITKVVPCAYNREAECPKLMETLKHAFGDNKAGLELQTFFQRWAGYSATGAVGDEVFLIAWGRTGGNGKTTLYEALHRSFGQDYARSANPELFDEFASSNFALSAIAQLRGIRMVTMAETKEGGSLNSELIKRVTGGEPINCKTMYHDAISYFPQFKPVLYTNHRPVVRDMEEPLWKRLAVLPFVRQIPKPWGRREDVNVELDAEREGILAWVVRGAVDWFAKGLEIPEAMKVATASYRADMNQVGEFVADEYEFQPRADPEKPLSEENAKALIASFNTLTVREMYSHYSLWCYTHHIKYQLSARRFDDGLRHVEDVTVGDDRADGTYKVGGVRKRGIVLQANKKTGAQEEQTPGPEDVNDGLKQPE